MASSSSNWGNQYRYGEYEIVGAREKKPHLLGQGTFGKTFEAVRTDTVAGGTIKEYVAIKVLNPDLLKSESRRFQFFQELAALTKFKHSNLIHYIRSGEENGEIFYAMELCRGGDLSKLVARFGKLPEQIAALIGCQVAAGLREMHQRQRLVHRDIKPSNIMLVDELDKGLGLEHLAYAFESQENLCRIVDFGLVNFAAEAPDAPQRFAGSPMYSSPEQIREQPVDFRSDIYSLGMTLWYLVQGEGPLLDSHGRQLKDMGEAMERHTQSQEHEADLPSGLDGNFRRLLARMIAKRPEQRFKTAADVQEALREYLSAAEPEEEEGFAVEHTSGLLEERYRLKRKLPSRSGFQTFLAQELSTDEEGAPEEGPLVTITVVADVEGVSRGVPEIEAVAQQLCEAAELSAQPSTPAALLSVSKVIWAADRLAYAEEYFPHAPLSEVLVARGRSKRPIPFPEAVTVLSPLAEGLDYMLRHGRRAVLLPSDEIWLSTGQELSEEESENVLTLPFPEWDNLRVCFSSVYLPQEGADSSSTGATPTISGSMQMSESELHPVPSFARLVYRILNGTEVAAAAHFTPHAYVPTVTLGPASNNLLRDLLCQERPWTTVRSVVKELCANEGVAAPKRRSPGGTTAPRTDRSTHPSTADATPPPMPPVGIKSGGSSSAGSSDAEDETPPVAAARRTAIPPPLPPVSPAPAKGGFRGIAIAAIAAIFILVIVLVVVIAASVMSTEKRKEQERQAQAQAEQASKDAEEAARLAREKIIKETEARRRVEKATPVPEPVDKAAELAKENDAKAARAVERYQAVVNAKFAVYQSTYAAFSTKGGIAPKSLKSSRDADERIALLKTFEAANTDLLEFMRGATATLRQEMKKEGLPQKETEAAIRAYFASNNVDTLIGIRETDSELCILFTKYLRLLRNEWGWWNINQSGTVIFQDTGTVEMFNIYVDRIKNVAARQDELQQKIATPPQPPKPPERPSGKIEARREQ